MKTQKTLLALALFITLFSFGQTNVLNTTGNVLIGTTIDNGTTDKLQVNGTASGSAATSPNHFTTKAQLDLKSDDNNVVKLTGNQTKTGILTMTNPSGGGTGIVMTNNNTSNNAITIYNNGGSSGKAIYVQNNAAQYGIYSVNSGTYGIYSTNTGSQYGIYSVNSSTGQGIYSLNSSSGNGIVSNTTYGGTSFNYVGQNFGSNTFTVSKAGITTASSFVKTGGTSSQFLKADGSSDSSIYLTGTGTSSYLPKFTATNTFGNSLIFDDGTKIGIGTTSPQSKLQVAGSITLPLPGTSEISEEGISFAANHRFNYDGKFINHYGFGFYPYSQSIDTGGVNTYMSGYYGLDFFTADTNRMRILYNGNVGIGTINPQAKLDLFSATAVNGPILSIRSDFTALGKYAMIRFGDQTQTSLYQKGAIIYEGVAGSARGRFHIALNNDDTSNSVTLNDAKLTVQSDGKVGIGTTNPDQKLTVKGKIHAEEIIVNLSVPADYVFQKYYTGKSELKSDYVMPTLAEIESFTKKNNHLPDVPSAQEIQQNGVSLGEMSNVLLQKVEELTLYIIKQNKDIEALKAQVTSLMAKKQ